MGNINSPVPSRKNLDPRIARTLSRHIERYYKETPHELRDGGSLWYPRASDLAEHIGKGDVHKGAGIIAALSPQTGWARNVELAKKARRGQFGGQTGDNVEKAKRISDGEHPEDVLGGHKVRNFYRNIVNPSDPTPVTIDRHAHDIAVNMKYSGAHDESNARGLSASNRYNHFADAYRTAAHRVGEPRTNAVQASTWLRWAGYDPNEGFPKGF